MKKLKFKFNKVPNLSFQSSNGLNLPPEAFKSNGYHVFQRNFLCVSFATSIPSCWQLFVTYSMLREGKRTSSLYFYVFFFASTWKKLESIIYCSCSSSSQQWLWDLLCLSPRHRFRFSFFAQLNEMKTFEILDGIFHFKLHGVVTFQTKGLKITKLASFYDNCRLGGWEGF